MRVTYQNRVFIAQCTYEEREIPRKAGFRWHPGDKRWYTTNYRIGARLREFCDESAKKELSKVFLRETPWSGSISTPPNQSLFPFQKQAIAFALKKNRSYLALDAGLGKTICAAVMANSKSDPFVYICPPFLKANVERELKKWIVRDIPYLIFTDSKLHSLKTFEVHDFIKKYTGHMLTLFVDEAHRFKTDSAKRTRILLDTIVPQFDRVIFLSGTPMPNSRPMELFPILSAAAPELIDFKTKFEFGMRYCAGYKSNWGWDFSGSSHLNEFKEKLPKFVLRIKKKDVLKDLPPKTRQIVFLEKDMPKAFSDMEQKFLRMYSPEDLVKNEIGADHFATYRKELSVVKAPFVCEYIDFLLDSDPKEKILLFGVHKKGLETIFNGLSNYHPLLITGKTPVKERQNSVDMFQDGHSRLLILNIQAGGVGFNLTKATRVVFSEFSYVPGENEQAEDRAHRIGQTENILVQYLVYKDSIDAKILESNFQKQKQQEKMEH